MSEQYDLLPSDLWRIPQWAEDRLIRKWMRNEAGLIRRCDLDGIPQVAPICAALRQRPDQARASLGKGLWKKVHHSRLQDNVLRAKCVLITNIGLPDVMAIPVGALREVPKLCARYGPGAVRATAGLAKNKVEMREMIGLVHDVRRMNGTVTPGWSMRRLREEHDKLARVWARKTASTELFAEPWCEEIDGYKFTRLISPADFAEEGLVMRHCIASYAPAAKRGREVAFRIEGPERASVSFRHSGHIELKGYMNAPVSDTLRRAARKIVVDFKRMTAK